MNSELNIINIKSIIGYVNLFDKEKIQKTDGKLFL